MATRVRGGVRQVLYGGVVSWDLRRGRDAHGFPRRRTKILRAWGRVVDEADCGRGTAYVVRLLKARAERKLGGGRNVEVSESWRY